MSMEKRNLIEPGRTPELSKQGDSDLFEKEAIDAFSTTPSTDVTVKTPAERVPAAPKV
jgi:hypothetical protein